MKVSLSPSAKRRPGKKKSFPKHLKTNLNVPSAKTANGFPSAEHPETSLQHILRGVVRRGLKPQLPD